MKGGEMAETATLEDNVRTFREPSGGSSPAFLFPTVPADTVRAAYEKAPGNEFTTGKMASPESSAALVANTFGFFLLRPADLPRLPPLSHDVSWPPLRIGLEECARFPWSGGHHPWLDVLIETPSHLIGVESKRYEPFRSKAPPTFSEAYWRPVWGEHMKPFEAMRDRLRDEPTRFVHLDAAQLVKHAFGLRTLASRDARRRRPMLVYLYAEPQAWPDARAIDPAAVRRHTVEVRKFADAVAEAEVEVEFEACTYHELLAAMRAAPVADVGEHAEALASAYRL